MWADSEPEDRAKNRKGIQGKEGPGAEAHSVIVRLRVASLVLQVKLGKAQGNKKQIKSKFGSEHRSERDVCLQFKLKGFWSCMFIRD
jgi:hypothetical protein